MKYTAVIIFLLFLFSCQLPVRKSETPGTPVVSKKEDPRLTAFREKVVEGAEYILKTKSLAVRGKTFNPDCSGTVLAVYYYAGIDLTKEFGQFQGSGVDRIYGIMGKYNLLHQDKMPNPGDIIFWDNTYDKNEDKKWNDELTHIGIVLRISDSGDIQYLHYNYSKGIAVEEMNLFNPEVHTKVSSSGEILVINAPMRMKSQNWDKNRWLSSHLFRDFAKGYYLGVLW